MATGLEGGAALVGLIGLGASALKGCIQGLILLSKARSYGRNVSGISLMMEIELHKLYSWAEEVGMTRSPPELQIEAQQAVLVTRILKHLQELVFDLEKLRTVHDLHLQEESDQLLRLDDAESAFRRLSISPHDGCQKFIANIFHQRSKPWKVLKWVTFDEQKARGLLDSIRSFISDLQQMLDRSPQAKITKVVDVYLRSAVLNTVNEQDLDMIGLLNQSAPLEGGVAAAARFKKQALLLGIMDSRKFEDSSRTRADSVMTHGSRRSSYPPINPRYSNGDLVRQRLHSSHLVLPERSGVETRLLAQYDGKPVLIEFRSETGVDRDLQKDRVCKVSLFLSNLDPSFHGLSCSGYVRVEDQFAYVYDLENVLNLGLTRSSAAPQVAYRSLRELLDATPSPSLNLRVAFAITLLETLLQLHTSGWLHKELRSDNMLFFLESPSLDVTDFLAADMQITGYAHARIDRLFEPTEPLESELEADLYRHPASLREPRETFRKAFDMFSVGCVLIELGIWCSLTALCRSFQQQGDDDDEIEESIRVDYMALRNEFVFPSDEQAKGESVLKRLEASAGRKYAEVVKTLLQASTKSSDDLLETEMDCLTALRDVADVL